MSTNLDDKTDIYSAFLKDLASGAIEPGDRLGEESLAARWNVSRLPVRDALIRLEAEGLVERLPNVGTYVRQINVQEVEELYELRAALEGVVVRHVATKATDKQLEELEKLARKADSMCRGGDSNKIIEYEMRFHQRLCEIANMRHALRLIRMQYLWQRCFRLALSITGGGPTDTHLVLVNELRTRHADRCEKLIKKQYELSRRIIVGRLLESSNTGSAVAPRLNS